MPNRSFTENARKALLRRGRGLLRHQQDYGEVSTDILAGLSECERIELAEIHKALNRIEEGVYGRCESCGQNVSPVLLDAVPWRRMCEHCDDCVSAQSIAAVG